jgi:hypothetical protein
MTRAFATFAVLAALTLGATGCLPDPEEGPTWSGEIRPMLIAHCGRCHDGSMFSEDPEGRPGSMSNFIPEAASTGVVGMALTRLDPALNPLLKAQPILRMPPSPAEPLKEWQIDMLKEWLEYPKP